MEITPPNKSCSFSSSIGYKMRSPSTPRTPPSPMINGESSIGQDTLHFTPDHDIHEVPEDIDQFKDALSTCNEKSSPQIPDSVETFAEIIESRIAKYNSGKTLTKFGKMTEEDSFFMEAVRRIWKLSNAFSEIPSSSTTATSLNRTSMVFQRAMTFLEEEFRSLVEDFRASNTKSPRTLHKDSDRCILPEPESTKEDDYPGYSSEIVTKINRIATTMISSGYETECCQIYSIARRNALNEEMKKLELEKINIDVQRIHWDSLEGEITMWIKAVKYCSDVLFPGERKLGQSIFSEYPSISQSIFSELARGVVIQLLDFADAVAITKRSAEKLFKFLDMYETLGNLNPATSKSCFNGFQHELKSKISDTGERIGEAALNIFSDLETSIMGDVARTPVPGGAVHPLTRYVMNYLKYACEYKGTLEHIFEQHTKLEGSKYTCFAQSNIEDDNESPRTDRMVANATPFSVQLMSVMDLLDSNLEAKSRFYKDPSLRYIFLMNNGRYILQKVKGSTEINQVMGDTWCRRRSTVVRQFHKNYQRETWGKVLQCLGHEGLQVSGKVYKPAVKERFKSFCMMLDEIHKTQSMWMASDEQLQSELRVSISSLVIPAYRSFLGRFRQYLDSGRSAEKFIKYQPEDIETLIEGLFDGNATSINKRKA